MYQLAFWWEATFGFGDLSFLKTLSTCLPISWWASIQQFLTKIGMTPVPYPPYSPNLALSNFLLVPWMKKALKGKHFADGEEVKQKMAEALKGIKIDEFKNHFEQQKKMSQELYFVKWRVLCKWLKFKCVRINTWFFINKFWVLRSTLINGNIKKEVHIICYIKEVHNFIIMKCPTEYYNIIFIGKFRFHDLLLNSQNYVANLEFNWLQIQWS